MQSKQAANAAFDADSNDEIYANRSILRIFKEIYLETYFLLPDPTILSIFILFLAISHVWADVKNPLSRIKCSSIHW